MWPILWEEVWGGVVVSRLDWNSGNLVSFPSLTHTIFPINTTTILMCPVGISLLTWPLTADWWCSLKSDQCNELLSHHDSMSPGHIGKDWSAYGPLRSQGLCRHFCPWQDCSQLTSHVPNSWRRKRSGPNCHLVGLKCHPLEKKMIEPTHLWTIGMWELWFSKSSSSRNNSELNSTKL